LCIQETIHYHARMLFSDPYIGEAIAILRAPLFTQKELAAALGIDKGTMNRYEKGTRSVPENVLVKIAHLIRLEVIDIWNAAFGIFRFNYFRDEAQRTGKDVEEVIARYGSHVTAKEIHAARASFLEKFDEWERLKTEFEAQQKTKGFTVLRHIVEHRAKKRVVRKTASKDRPPQKRPKK